MQNPTTSDLQRSANAIKHLTADQLEELMQAAMISARDHAMLLIIFHHGLRASEAADLKLSDINWASMEITIARKKGSLKTTQQLVSQRGKPALDEVKALRRWLAERRAMSLRPMCLPPRKAAPCIPTWSIACSRSTSPS